jgi:hypothetical protein
LLGEKYSSTRAFPATVLRIVLDDSPHVASAANLKSCQESSPEMHNQEALTAGHAGSKPRRYRFIIAVLSVGSLAITVAGCAPGSPAQPQISTAQPTAQATVSAAPSATPTVSALPPAPLTPEPPRLFGDDGTCESIIPTTTMSNIVGTDMTLDSILSDSDFTTTILGGISCYWNQSNLADGSRSVAMAVFPAAGPLPSTKDSQKCHDGVWCNASLAVNGYWFTWTVGESADVKVSAVAAASKALAKALRARAKAAGPATAFHYPAGSWSPTPDCARIAKTTGVLSTIGEPKWVLANRGPTGMSFTAPSVVAAIVYQTPEGCGWGPTHDGGPGFDFQIYPGGAWYASRLATQPGMEFVTIPGTTYALRQLDETGRITTVDSFDGVNWLRMSCGSDEIYARNVGLIPSILAELDKRPAAS